MSTEPHYLTIAAVAERWQCSRDTVERRIKARELPATRLGDRTLRIELTDLERYELQKTLLGSEDVMNAVLDAMTAAKASESGSE